MALALFDLDNTLLSGDSDVLWSEFLVAQGQLDPSFKERADEMQAAYLAGTVSPDDICNFSASSVAGRSPAELLDLRQRFHRFHLPLSGMDQPHLDEQERNLLRPSLRDHVPQFRVPRLR